MPNPKNFVFWALSFSMGMTNFENAKFILLKWVNLSFALNSTHFDVKIR